MILRKPYLHWVDLRNAELVVMPGEEVTLRMLHFLVKHKKREVVFNIYK